MALERAPDRRHCRRVAAETAIIGDYLRRRSEGYLFSIPATLSPYVTPAANLTKQEVRNDIVTRLTSVQPVFIYFDAKTGGELSIPATDRSPEFAFDVTITELMLNERGEAHIGRFGILEIQTMDFHGSYRSAVRNLRDGLRLHPRNFPETLQENQHWLSEDVEGPNIANVVKRTFYQMMFKFQLGRHDRCAGCVLAIPGSVWDSWQRHLGEPSLVPAEDGSFDLLAPGAKRPEHVPAWIYVFEPDSTSIATPSPIALSKMIATDVPAMSHWALEIAPQAALTNIDSANGFFSLMARRLKKLWPELAKTITV